MMGMVCVLVVEQPDAATVTVRTTEPDAPAVYCTAFVFWPSVSVPLEIVQTNVAPTAGGTEAGLLMVRLQTDAAAVIVLETATIVLEAELDAESPQAFITVTWASTVPVAPAVKVMVSVF